MKRYTFNHEYFLSKGPEQAYWAGFIIADGCVSRGRDLIIVLQNRDRRHLRRFVACIGGDNAVRTAKQSRLAIRSVKMIEGLRKWGVTERKSLTATPPHLPPALARHFWRGVFDGDGHLGIHSGVVELSLVGTWAMVNGFSKFVQDALEIQRYPERHKGIWRIRYNGSFAQRVASAVYRGEFLCLHRKYQTYEKISKLQIKQRTSRRYTVEYLEKLYASSCNNWSKVSRQLGMYVSNLRRIRRRLGML